PVSTLQLFDGSDNGSDYESMDGVRTEDRDTEDDTMEDDEEDDYMMKDLPAVDHGPTESELTYSEPSGGEESDEEQLDEGPYKEIREHMQTYITARDTDYFSECTHQETANLASLIETVLQEKDIGLATLETVAAECEKVAVTLDKTITLVNAVKQDILDTGSTSLRRWNQLQSMEWNVCRLRHLAEGVPGVPTAAIIDEMVEDITRDVSAWQARLGLTLKLTRDLELAI
ncbi:uncharacterized protein B0H64DRAFT_294212, partial [Chaetomium fimeti]